MADNPTVDNGGLTDYKVAADEVTYSGDTANVQLQRPVHVTGSEGSKTVVDITDANGQFTQGPVAHDAPQAGNPVLLGGRASAAAPADVSGDNDAVRAWFLRNGAQATVLTAAGALVGGDATNGLDVDVTRVQGSVAVTNAGTFATQVDGSALTALQLIDDIVYTDDTSTHSTGASKGALIMAAATPSDASVNANDIGAVAMTTDRKLHVAVMDPIPAGTNNIGDVDVLTLPPVTNAGTFVVQVDGNALTSLQLIDDIVYTDDTSTHSTGSSKGALIMAAATPSDTSVNANDIGAVAMTTDRKLHVAVMDPIPAGTNNIGDVDILSIAAGDNTVGRVKLTDGTLVASVRDTGSSDSLNVAIVDGSGNQITSFGGGTQYTEDVAAAADPVGTAQILVRADSLGAVTNTDGDNVAARGTNKGELYVKHADTLAVSVPADPFGVNADAASATGSISAKLRQLATAIKAEDSGHNNGDLGFPVWGVRNDADASFGADLDYVPVSVDLGGNQNVRARRDLVRVSVQSSGLTTSASAYVAGDTVGTQFTVAGVARASGGSGTIVGVEIISAADTIGPFDVVFTDSSITLASDNAAYAISDADALKIIGLVNCAANYDIGNNRIAQAFNLAIPYVCSGGTSIYAGLICRSGIASTPFAAGTDIQLIVYVERN